MILEAMYTGLVLTAGTLIGFVAGYIVGRTSSGEKQAAKNNLISYIVILVWTISVVVDMFIPDYQTPIYVHIIASIVIGSLYKVPIIDIFKK